MAKERLVDQKPSRAAGPIAASKSSKNVLSRGAGEILRRKRKTMIGRMNNRGRGNGGRRKEYPKIQNATAAV